MLTTIGLLWAVSEQAKPAVLSILEAELRMGRLLQRAARAAEEVPHIPNGYRPGDPVPYMPGSGEPLIGREETEGKMHLVGVPGRK